MNARSCLLVFLLLVGLLIAAIFGYAYSLPKSMEVDRSVTIQAAPATIHPWVDTLSRWPEWSAWGEQYPDTNYAYQGPQSGAGAITVWTDEEAGDGKIEITASDPEKGVWYDMWFDENPNPSKGAFSYIAKGEVTEVHWTMRAEATGVLERIVFKLFQPAIEEDFDKGLAKLKAGVEAGG